MKNKISIIIPVFNQFRSLVIVMECFSMQKFDRDGFEIIIVDDGSEDQIKSLDGKYFCEKYGIETSIYHQMNQGRAVARNTGIEKSSGNILIFCDADRFPAPNFLSLYMESHIQNDVIVGASPDFYGNQEAPLLRGYNQVEKLSRLALYQKKINGYLFDKNGMPISDYSWLGFLVGNASLKKSVLNSAGNFSPKFREWGFEHFELAYRIVQSGYKIHYNGEIKNYHLVHKRSENFYQNNLYDSALLFHQLHQEINYQALYEFFVSSNEKYDIKKMEYIKYDGKNQPNNFKNYGRTVKY